MNARLFRLLAARDMRARLVRILSAVAIGAAVAVILLLQGYLLWQVRAAAWNSAMRSAENVLATLSASIERNLNIVDLSLAGVQEAFHLVDLKGLDPQIRNMALFDRAGTAEYLGSMLVLSPTGKIIYDSGGSPARDGDFFDRDYFQVHRDRQAGTYLSAPYDSRLRAGDPSIALSRRLTGPDGQFEGVVMGAVRLAYFSSLFSNVRLGRSGIISITRTDGTMVMRTPSTDGKGNVGLNIGGSPTFQRMLSGPVQDFTARAVVDGITRHYVYGRLGSYPLVLAVGFSVEDVFDSWIAEAVTIFGTGVLVCIIIIGLFISLQRALARQMKVEDELERLATTDVLTGLSNRRQFDDALSREWDRTARLEQPLSLLIVDVDRFKSVNDNFGHEMGDQLLRAIADAISSSLLRPDDVSARYGGDEFAVLLPATGREGALGVGERIRSRVEDLQLSDGKGRVLRATVSIGLGTVHVPPDGQMESLFRAADLALYKAKDAGRNSVAALP
ncbi:sensor domain-containing diguanylate cyclase [Azorhizobium sp. AG788]|uniref:sensor domain-containing diguanylate cyclase n=1 Tax=Azorhizobium sp. AG788 TaxID=2183897 RepID=UPI00313A2EDD